MPSSTARSPPSLTIPEAPRFLIAQHRIPAASKSGKIAPIVWIGLLLSAFQQFVGINVIFYYSNILWEAVGFDESQAFVITVIGATINILTTLVAIATVDRFGRKPLLLIGSVGMTVTLATMAVIFGQASVVDGDPVLEGAAGPIALIAANLFVVAFGMSWAYGLYATFALLSFFFVLRFIEETKGKQLEDMEG